MLASRFLGHTMGRIVEEQEHVGQCVIAVWQMDGGLENVVLIGLMVVVGMLS